MTNKRPLPEVLSRMVVGLATVAILLAGAVPMASAAPFAYIAHGLDVGTVSVIDASNYSLVGSVGVGAAPSGVAANAAGTKAYVANSGGTTLSVIETTVTPGTPPTVTVKVAATVPLVRGNPNAVALNATETIAYVAHGDGWISVVDTNSYTVTAFPTIAGYGLKGIAISADGTRLYVTAATLDGLQGRVLAIDPATQTVVATLIQPSDLVLSGIAVNPAGTRVYAVGSMANRNGFLAVVNDPTSATPSRVNVPLGGGVAPVGVVVHPLGNLVYVTNQALAGVSVVYAPTNTVVTPALGIRVARSPLGIAVDPSGQHIFVLSDNGTLSVIDPASQLVKAWALPIPGVPLSFGAFVGGSAGGGSSKLQEELEAAYGTIARLTTELATAEGLRKDLAAANEKVRTLTAELAAATSMITKLQVSVDSLAPLQAELAAAKDAVKTLSDELESANLTIASFVRRLMTGRTDSNVAYAARQAAERQIALAVTKLGAKDPRVRHAQREFNSGVDAYDRGQFARALKEFVDAFESASRLRKS